MEVKGFVITQRMIGDEESITTTIFVPKEEATPLVQNFDQFLQIGNNYFPKYNIVNVLFQEGTINNEGNKEKENA